MARKPGSDGPETGERCPESWGATGQCPYLTGTRLPDVYPLVHPAHGRGLVNVGESPGGPGYGDETIMSKVELEQWFSPEWAAMELIEHYYGDLTLCDKVLEPS